MSKPDPPKATHSIDKYCKQKNVAMNLYSNNDNELRSVLKDIVYNEPNKNELIDIEKLSSEINEIKKK